MPSFLKLGWNNPRPNDFQSADERPLKDLFGHLQRFMTWPYVGLRFDGTQDLTSGLAVVNWTGPKSAAATPFVEGDPYSLYRSGPKNVQVPRDFDTWLAVGAAGFNTAGTATTAVFSAGWRIDAVTDVWISHWTGNPGSRGVVPIISPVKKGQTLDIVVASTETSAEDLVDAEAWVFFLPLA